MSEAVGSNEFRRKKLTTTQAGYGWEHQQARRRLAPFVDSGHASCARCGGPIRAGEKWHLDHRDDGRGYIGVSHPSCNSAAPHLGTRPVTLADFVDDAARRLYWGPPSTPGGVPRRWSRAWFTWRGELPTA